MSKNEFAYEKKTVYKKASPEAVKKAFDYAEEYKSFIDAAKTEREAVDEAIRLASARGFREYRLGDKISVGDKLYYNNRNKNLFLFTVGKEPLECGIRISAAHIDSPRIDLKQCPVYEDGGMSFFKTHYYGGLRKYQWLALPLALHGVIIKADGEKINIAIGEKDDDPVFYINDLLPHLAHKQGRTPLDEAVDGEKLNILIGSMTDDGEESTVKDSILKILNDKYGIVEEDFISAELSAVPAGKARDLGFDRSMICAYGHDDRVCAFPALSAILDSADSDHTLLCILADKEETGSEGNSGMQCVVMLDLIREISKALGANEAIVRANSKCLSADVSAAYDPNFSEVFEKQNCALLSCGAIFMKFTGARGKSSTNDASAEYIAWLRKILDKDGIIWQTGELGKVDCGGGGTVAKYIAKHNIDTIDLGVPLISMHAPYEVVSKVDIYETYRAIRAFNKN
ncbi:MAG: aminopeptidase [Clostridia bacterium]|nr:aminopeptidase [Clostridia bacterium]